MSARTPAEEARLAESARLGDEAARDLLYREFFLENRQVRNLLAREVRDPSDREDILHDAFVSLVRSRAEFRGDARLATYVYRVVQVAILQRIRSRKASREDRMLRLSYDFQGSERERELAVTDYGFEKVEAGATAAKLLALLPEPLRMAFRLRVLDELSYEEIAQATGAPVNTVATRLFKARGILARLLGAPGEPGKTGGQREE